MKLKIAFLAVTATSLLAACGGELLESESAPAVEVTANDTHSWAGYHWARTSNPFTLKLGDNVTAQWDGILDTSVTDWTSSNVLDVTKVAGAAKGRCRPTPGRVEICNDTYGANGWLGIAQIWLSGGHISQGTVKLNDTYYNTAQYNTPAWRNMVMCQEIGHTFGLDHQDEVFANANLGTCMDYTNDPSTNQHPNNHDFAMLQDIYQHVDATTTVGASAPNGNAGEAPAWGQQVDDHTFVNDLANGTKVVTFVVWVP